MQLSEQRTDVQQSVHDHHLAVFNLLPVFGNGKRQL